MLDHVTKVPLSTFVLVLLLCMIGWVLFRIQFDKNGMDLKDMIRDDRGKPSAVRLGTLVAIAMGAWFLMRYAESPEGIDPTVLALYLGPWVIGVIGHKYTENRPPYDSYGASYSTAPLQEQRSLAPRTSDTGADPPARVDPEELNVR